mgnify:CR=1 FL=1
MIDCTKTENYFTEKSRMTKRQKGGVCTLDCKQCPLYSKNNGTSKNLWCGALEIDYPEKAVEIVQKWSDEHQQRTYLSQLLENYPDASLDENGTPKNMCPSMLGLKDLEDCSRRSCVECWNQPVEDGEER